MFFPLDDEQADQRDCQRLPDEQGSARVSLSYGFAGGSGRPRDAGFDAGAIAVPATANSATTRLIPRA
jgi:hypothetical protein